MENDEVILIVPEELHQDGDLVVDLFREALQESGDGDPEQVKIVKTQIGSFDDGSLAQMFLSFGVGSLGWLTTKWADEYIWPLIQKKIDKRSKDLLVRIKKLISAKD